MNLWNEAFVPDGASKNKSKCVKECESTKTSARGRGEAWMLALTFLQKSN